MIRIRTKDVKGIISHCEKEQPIEACGILAGKITRIDGAVVKEVLKVYTCRNELNSPTEYRINAEEQLQIFDEIDRSGLDLLGFYHSHPYTNSQPSPIDKERGNYFGYSYVIVSLQPAKVSSWILEEDGFKEEEISTISDQES
jgi:proteasome lid subunit RPN8/RPN11